MGGMRKLMTIVNRHRKGAIYPSTVSNDDLEEANSDFTTLCNGPIEFDSAPFINSLELLKQTAFINADKNYDNNDDFDQRDERICCKSKLLEIFASTEAATRGVL